MIISFLNLQDWLWMGNFLKKVVLFDWKLCILPATESQSLAISLPLKIFPSNEWKKWRYFAQKSLKNEVIWNLYCCNIKLLPWTCIGFMKIVLCNWGQLFVKRNMKLAHNQILKYICIYMHKNIDTSILFKL